MGTTEQVNYIRKVIYMQCKSKNVLVFKSRKIILKKIRLYSLIIWPCNQNLCEKEKKKGYWCFTATSWSFKLISNELIQGKSSVNIVPNIFFCVLQKKVMQV